MHLSMGVIRVQIVLATPPSLCSSALLWGLPVAHMAFRYAGGALWQQPLPEALHGGYMALRVAPGPFDCTAAARALLRRCAVHGFTGIVAEPEADGAVFPLALQKQLLAEGLTLILAEYWGEGSDARTGILASTAVSGGTLQGRLETLLHQYGAGRLALDLERLSHRFPLPCPGGQGERVTQERLRFLQGMAGPAFLSEALGCKYCFLPQGNRMEVLLFDDADSLTCKLRLARLLGIQRAFLLFGEADSSMLDAAIRLNHAP